MKVQGHKRHHSMPMLCIGILLAFYSHKALAFTEGNYTYTTNGAGQATMTGFNTYYYGDLSITNVLGGFPLTAIESGAFAGCYNITSITIPASIVTIGDDPFAWGGGPAMTNITVDAANPAYASAEGVLFDKNLTELIRYPSGKKGSAYTVPAGVVTLGTSAFGGNFNITSIVIPDSVSAIGEHAFSSCWYLSSVNIPDGITRINASVFGACSALTSLSIPDTVTYIGDGAFSGCAVLTSLNIPDGVTYIGAEAFNGVGLDSITIPRGVTNINNGTFYYCPNLTAIDIPDNITSIGAEAFMGSGLLSIRIPGSVTNIGDHAFAFSPNLVSASIPGSVTAVGDFTFYDCPKLTSVLFGGDPPALGGPDVFFYFFYPTVVYYLPGTFGWGTSFGGCPTVCWDPTVQSFVFDGNEGQFGLTVTGGANIPVVVEARTNLASGVWTPLLTNTLGASGSLHFADPTSPRPPSRFYRIVFP